MGNPDGKGSHHYGSRVKVSYGFPDAEKYAVFRKVDEGSGTHHHRTEMAAKKRAGDTGAFFASGGDHDTAVSRRKTYSGRKLIRCLDVSRLCLYQVGNYFPRAGNIMFSDDMGHEVGGYLFILALICGRSRDMQKRCQRGS